MTYKNEFIYVGNPEKGYALFNKTTGEYLTDFEYSNIVNTNYGLHFLYKAETEEYYTIVDDDGKEVTFDRNYFWGSLGRCPFGVGVVVCLADNKFHLANCKGEILSKGFDRRLDTISSTSRIYETTNVLTESNRKLKGLIDITGEEIVPCEDEYIPVFDDIFVLTELVEKHGYGLIKYASDDILASDMLFIKLLEAAIKSIRTLPAEIDKVGFITALADSGVDYMYYLRSEICFEKAIFRKKAEVNVKEVYDRFGNLIDKLFEEGHIQNRILAGFLKKKVEVVLEKVIGTSANVFIFD